MTGGMGIHTSLESEHFNQWDQTVANVKAGCLPIPCFKQSVGQDGLTFCNIHKYYKNHIKI